MKNALRFCLTLFAAFIVYAGCISAARAFFEMPFFGEGKVESPEPLSIRAQDGTEYQFLAEIADSYGEREKGLMGRETMADRAAMLFLFGETSQHAFWMKNTLISLDMLFLGRDGRILHIHHNAVPQDLTPVTSELPSFAVLEIKGGQADLLGIKEGDQVIHPAFRNDLPLR